MRVSNGKLRFVVYLYRAGWWVGGRMDSLSKGSFDFFIPRRESAKADPMGPLDGLSILLCDCWTKLKFQFRNANPTFWESQKPLSPENKYASTPAGVQLISLSNYYCHTVNEHWSFNFELVISRENFVPKPFLCGWVDGRTDGDFYLLRFYSNSSILTSNICWFEIWTQKLPASILNFNFEDFMTCTHTENGKNIPLRKRTLSHAKS